jgi:hypothetical protein
MGLSIAPDRTVDHALDATFRAVAPHLPAALVRPAAFDRVLSLVERLPAALTTYAGLECRLAGADTQVDAFLDINLDGRHILAGRTPRAALPDCLAERTEWQRLRDLCQAWIEPTSPLHHALRGLWLEFDLDRAPSRVPPPSVFLRFEGGSSPHTSLTEAEKSRILTETALPMLTGRPLANPVKTRVRACLEALPPGARLTEAGLMLQRGSDAVRLCFTGLAERRIPAYLRRVGWEGPSESLKETLTAFSEVETTGRAARMQVGYLDIDVSETVHPAIGLEYFFLRQLAQELRESRWLDELVRRGLCAPEKCAGLLEWPGHAPTRLAHLERPGLLVRRTNHVKLVLPPEGPLLAKAYLCLFSTTPSNEPWRPAAPLAGNAESGTYGRPPAPSAHG